MKAAVYYEKHVLKVEEVPVREPEDDEVVIRVHACGVCGTDRHIYEGSAGSSEVTAPLIIGHEIAGEIVRMGKNVTRFQIGDRVSVDPNIPCDKCYFCKSGKQHFCTERIGLGTMQDGGFAEYLTVVEKQVFLIPDHLTYNQAAMCETVSCALNGIDLTNVKVGDTVLIIGAGQIGLLMVQLARSAGASRIIVSDPIEQKLKTALKLGATLAINPMEEDLGVALKENHVMNVDRVIECVGSRRTMADAVKYAGMGATVMMFGLTDPDTTIDLRPYEVFQKELHITSSFINPYTYHRAIEVLSSGTVKVDDIITDLVPLEQINEVFETDKYKGSCKVVITM